MKRGCLRRVLEFVDRLLVETGKLAGLVTEVQGLAYAVGFSNDAHSCVLNGLKDGVNLTVSQ